MKTRRIIRNLAAIAIAAGFIGSLIATIMLYPLFILFYYWENYLLYGERLFELGSIYPKFPIYPKFLSIEFIYNATLVGAGFTIPITLIFGTPVAYLFKRQIHAFPKTTIVVFTTFGIFFNQIMTNLFSLNRNMLIEETVIQLFAATTALIFGLLVIRFLRRLPRDA